MWLLDRLFPGRKCYEVCEEHGHDYRDNGHVTYSSVLKPYDITKVRETHEVDECVATHEDEYGEMYSALFIYREETVVCRDCGKDRTEKDRAERLVLCEDGGFKQSDVVFTEIEDDEENNA